MDRSVAVVIPYYHSQLDEYEMISYRQCIAKLSNYPIYLLIPEDMDEDSCLVSGDVQILKVKSGWLKSIDSYNRMMLNIDFYKMFENYKYILIYQLDAIVFSDQLDYFCGLGYDYIGAPWLEGVINRSYLECGVKYVGNGGFSLRKISSFIKVLEVYDGELDSWVEDVFWSNCKSEVFRVAPIEVALSFAFESQVRRCFELNKHCLPFGCHAWMKFDLEFWKQYLPPEDNPFNDLEIRESKDLTNNYLDKGYFQVSKRILTKWFNERNVERIYIFGAGTIGKCYGFPLRVMKNCSYIDNNPQRWGKKLNGMIIENPLIVKSANKRLIIIAVKDRNAVIEQLKIMDVDLEKEVIMHEQFVEAITDALPPLLFRDTLEGE